MFGPLEGRRHDAFMLAESGLLAKLQRFHTLSGEPYVIYGDPAYGVSRHILAPFHGARLTPQQQDFNRAMSKVRVSVEWAFGKIFAILGLHGLQKESKNSFATSWQVLPCCCPVNQLPYMFVWLINIHFF